MAKKKPTFSKVSEVEKYALRNVFILKDEVSESKDSKGGRPSVVTQEVVRKLEYAFVYDSTVEEACLYAGISRTAYYDFCKKYPRFTDRIEALRHAAIFVIRKRVVIAATQDANLGLKYLERKLPMEFGLRAYVHHSGETVDRHTIDPETAALIKRAMGNFAKKVSKEEKSKPSKPLSLFEPNQQG